MEELDVVILGSGFCASVVAKNCSDRSLKFRVIQPRKSQQVVEISKSEASVFSEEEFAKTSGLGGGIGVWGKGLTFPSSLNWFLPKGNQEWEALQFKLSNIRPLEEMKVPIGTSSQSIFSKRFLRNVKSSFYEEVGRYSGFRLGAANTATMPLIDSMMISEGLVISIDYDGHLYRTVVENPDYSTTELRSKKLVAASGTILNACYFSLLSGCTEFPISNHFSAELAKVHFRRPLVVRDCIQTYSSGEKYFSTFADIQGLIPDSEIPNSALRLQGNPLKVSRTETLDAILRFRLRFLVKRVLPIVFARLLGCVAVDSCTIRFMADQPINDKNRIKIQSGDLGKFSLNMTLEIDKFVVSDAIRVTKLFTDELSKSRIVQSISLLNVEAPVWRDTAHYFGTTPVGLPDCPSSVTQDSESRYFTGFFMLGNSTFPVGSHGHPTLLSILLAELASQEIVSAAS